MSATTQQKQSEWHDQWSMLQDNEVRLFTEWIYPFSLEQLRGRTVLEAGCGGGQHTALMVPYAASITAVDLNTADIAQLRNQKAANVRFMEADVATMQLGEQFDVVISIGVVHHTDDPDQTVRNLICHLKPGGRLILWVYAKEGNFLVEYVVEPLRKLFFRHLPKNMLLNASTLITVLMTLPIYTLYRLPLTCLPFYEYFENFRKLSFKRNVMNVFDKLNAPQVQFISRSRAESWIPSAQFAEKHISPYCGVSWRVSAVLRN